MNNAIFYPRQHEELLRKAGLLGTGFLEVRAVQRYKLQNVSEDGITFREEKRPEIDDIATGNTSPVFDSSGLIAGYWANGLTSEEKRIINEECGVPFFYLNEPNNPLTGKPYHPDTILSLNEGQLFNLSNPRDVAYVRVLFEVVSTIGKDKQEAMDHGAFFYFFSKEEEKQEKEKEIKKRKGAAALIDKLSKKQKRDCVRILILDGDYPADPYVNEDIAEEIFDEVAFSMPYEVLRAYDTEKKENYICAKALIHSGHIEANSIDGPYFKNPTVYGQKTHLADSLSELMVKIDTHFDLMKAYRELEGIVVGENRMEKERFIRDAASVSFLSKHGLYEKGEQPNVAVAAKKQVPANIKFMNVKQLIDYMDSENIVHDFTESSNLKEAKEYLTNYIDNQ
jgi:hypothetical protein